MAPGLLPTPPRAGPPTQRHHRGKHGRQLAGVGGGGGGWGGRGGSWRTLRSPWSRRRRGAGRRCGWRPAGWCWPPLPGTPGPGPPRLLQGGGSAGRRWRRCLRGLPSAAKHSAERCRAGSAGGGSAAVQNAGQTRRSRSTAWPQHSAAQRGKAQRSAPRMVTSRRSLNTGPSFSSRFISASIWVGSLCPASCRSAGAQQSRAGAAHVGSDRREHSRRQQTLARGGGGSRHGERRRRGCLRAAGWAAGT